MLVMTAALLAVGFVMYKRQQRHMQAQVRDIIAVRFFFRELFSFRFSVIAGPSLLS
jgi:predicted membrane protein